jgi:D-methionine transport system substrate-binding protein
MNVITPIRKFILFLVSCLLITACDSDTKKIDVNNTHDNFIRVGVMVGSEEQFMEIVKNFAAKNYDLTVELIPYAYAQQLNKALVDHEIDANIFQYTAYLDYAEKKYGYKLGIMGYTYIYPMGIYSRKYNSIVQIPQNALIAIPNEPTNEARALFLLEHAGLIRMASDDNLAATTDDIVSNPHQLKFKKFPSNELIDVLPHVDIAAINAGFAIAAGLLPSSHSLAIENKNSNYANVIAIRQGEEYDPGLKALVQIMHSPEIQHEVNMLYKREAIPAW